MHGFIMLGMARDMTKLLLKEITERIHLHLRRMELDPSINTVDPTTGRGILHRSGCRPSGSRVFVWYVDASGPAWLARKEAEEYLEWLDAGNHGRHSDAGIKTLNRVPQLRRPT